MVGLYAVALFVVMIASAGAAVLKKQRYAPLVLGMGLGVAVLIAASLYFNSSLIYEWSGINIYVAMMIAAMLIVAGGTGLILKYAMLLLAWVHRRHAQSLTTH